MSGSISFQKDRGPWVVQWYHQPTRNISYITRYTPTWDFLYRSSSPTNSFPSSSAIGKCICRGCPDSALRNTPKRGATDVVSLFRGMDGGSHRAEVFPTTVRAIGPIFETGSSRFSRSIPYRYTRSSLTPFSN